VPNNVQECLTVKTVKFKSTITKIICQGILDWQCCDTESWPVSTGQFVAWHRQFI